MRSPTGLLYTDDGQPEPFRGRRLGSGDIDAVIALHRRAIRALPTDLVATETRDFFMDHVECKGRLLGLFTRRGLVAYAVLGLPGPADANFGADHGLPADRMPQVAHLDGAGVDPPYRGNHLHRLLVDWRLDEARAAGRPVVLSTCAPGNSHSLDNLLACGLQIRGLTVKFGGWRYLLRRDLDLAAAPAGAGQWLAAEHRTAPAALLQAGWRGWATRNENCREIFFAPARDQPIVGWADQCAPDPVAEDFRADRPDSQPISRQ